MLLVRVQPAEPSFDKLRIVVYYLYILFCDKAFFYVGVTSDLKRRLRDHKSGFSSHTKRYKAIELVYKEEYSVRSVAEEREKQIKGWSRAKKKALISGNIDKLQGLSRSKS